MAVAKRRVVVADDHVAVRKGIRRIVEAHGQYVVCGEAENGLEAVKQSLDWNPDVVILDITMPVLNGIDAARQIHQKRPEMPILILSMHEYYTQPDALTDAGVRGYVTKSRTAEELIRAIQAVANGQTYFSPV